MTKAERTPLEELQEHLEMVVTVRSSMPLPDGFVFNGMEAFVLATGRAWTAKPRPANVRQMTPKYCFDNAYRLAARSRGRLRYVEGYATTYIPMHHAWTVDRDGNVVDPTWEYDADSRLGADTPYFGTEFPLESVRAARAGGCYSVIDNWHQDFPVLRGIINYKSDQLDRYRAERRRANV